VNNISIHQKISARTSNRNRRCGSVDTLSKSEHLGLLHSGPAREDLTRLKRINEQQQNLAGVDPPRPDRQTPRCFAPAPNRTQRRTEYLEAGMEQQIR
jgi:hypothetical protein